MTHRFLLPFVPAVAGVLALGACASPAEEPAQASLAGSEASAEGDAEIAPAPAQVATPSGGQPWDDSVSQACAEVAPDGFSERAQSPHDQGSTSFWAAGKDWVVCDVTTETGPVLVDGSDGAGFDEQSLAITSAVVSEGDEDEAVRFVAGGRLPWSVDQISYTFPDGHTEEARFVTGDGDAEEVWWVVTYSAVAGPLANPEVDAPDLAPVTVSVVGPAAEAFRLPFEDVQRSE